MTPPATIPPEIVACIATGRPPNEDELSRVARRVRREIDGQLDLRGNCSPFDRISQIRARRIAEAALAGGGARISANRGFRGNC